MARARRFPNRAAAVAASGLALGAAVVVASQGACITTPPPDLPTESIRPTILHDSVTPAVNEPLATWPYALSVPVQLNEANETFCWVVFIDYNPYPIGIGGTGLVGQGCDVALASDLDGGVVVVPVTLLPGALDLSVCHQIEFIVATGFEVDDHTPVPPGGDDIIWNYVPGGGPQCPLGDASGAFGDGAFPTDSPSDALLVPPPPPSDGATASEDAGTP